MHKGKTYSENEFSLGKLTLLQFCHLFIMTVNWKSLFKAWYGKKNLKCNMT